MSRTIDRYGTNGQEMMPVVSSARCLAGSINSIVRYYRHSYGRVAGALLEKTQFLEHRRRDVITPEAYARALSRGLRGKCFTPEELDIYFSIAETATWTQSNPSFESGVHGIFDLAYRELSRPTALVIV